jgi:hypothetical protein
MPLASLIEREHISPELTPILTTAFDNAWAKFQASGSPLAEDGCAPRRALCLQSGLSRRRRRARETPIV